MSQTELENAVTRQDINQIITLVRSGVSIHNPSTDHVRTPLQLALSSPSAEPLKTLLSTFFTSQSNTDTEQVENIVDLLVEQLYPQSISSVVPASLETEEDLIIARVKLAIDSVRRGGFVVICDGFDRENECDLIIAAESVTAEKIAFMVNHTSGIICVGITDERCNQLQLPQMVVRNTESHQTAFTVSVDYRHGTSTGISAADRAITIKALASSETQPNDLARPGHVFPLRAREGGVLIRPGHTEASVDVARLAGFAPAGVMSEIVKQDGSMLRPLYVSTWSKRFNIPVISIADIIFFRKLTETKA